MPGVRRARVGKGKINKETIVTRGARESGTRLDVRRISVYSDGTRQSGLRWFVVLTIWQPILGGEFVLFSLLAN